MEDSIFFLFRYRLAVLKIDLLQAALTGIRLVETLERIGLEEILATGPSSTLHQAGLRKRLADSVTGAGVLGVPGRPGRGELRRRQDLGSVPMPQHSRPDSPQPPTHSTLGTLSSLLFGRKGGLL